MWKLLYEEETWEGWWLRSPGADGGGGGGCRGMMSLISGHVMKVDPLGLEEFGYGVSHRVRDDF